MDQVLVRVQHLERANKRLCLLVAIAALLTAVLLFMGSAGTTPSVLEAQQFVLKDATGHERGKLFTTDTSWGLVLYNRDSSKAAGLVVSDLGNMALISDHKGNPRITALASDNESNFALSDVNTHQTKFELKNNAQGSSLAFHDDNGTDRVGMGFTPAGSAITFNDANSTTRALLEENIGLVTFDAKGSFLWGVGFDKFSKEEQEAMRKVMENSVQNPSKAK